MGENPAALRAAVFSLSSKNLRGGVQTPPPAGRGLNGVLMQGPDLTNSLTDVLVRFREGPCAFIADVEAMFYQVTVPEDDRDFMRFLWWPGGDTSLPPEEFRMRVHCFGATSSPSCANFALRKCADDCDDCDPDVYRAMKRNFYVDDCLLSVETPEDAIRLAKELKDLCGRGGFRLTKFLGNDRELLESLPREERGKLVTELDLSIDALPVEKALGVCWSVEGDSLGVRVAKKSTTATRRGILSTIASTYDPLGIVSPFALRGRLILQELTRLQIGWDEEIPLQQQKQWEAWLADLPGLADVALPRCYKPKNFGEVISAELHHFCDASQKPYGVVSFLRLKNSCGKVHCAICIREGACSSSEGHDNPSIGAERGHHGRPYRCYAGEGAGNPHSRCGVLDGQYHST